MLGEHERHSLVIPRSYLPAQAREGQVLRVTIQIDEDATHDAAERVASLLRELTGEG